MARRATAISANDPIPSLRKGSAPPAFVEAVEYFEVEQNTEEWHALRLGLVTASNFSKVLASGKDGGDSKGRAKYMRQLAGERLTGVPAETFSNAAMSRGHEMEPDARAHFEFTQGCTLRPIGFAKRSLSRGRFVGCSPDSLLEGGGVFENKTMQPDLLIELLDSGRFPTEHRAQCQGALWVTGEAVCHLQVYYRGMPVAAQFKIERDDVYIRELADAVEVFEYELGKLVERIKNMGGR